MKVVKRATRQAAASRAEPAKRSASGIKVIARAAEILHLLGDSKGLSLAGIADGVRLPRSTVHRIVLALEQHGLVSTNGPGKYRLGPEITHLAEASKLDSIRDLHPFLVRLSKELDETVDLSVRIGDSVTFVDQIIAMRRLRAVSALGRAFPLHCTANGKAVLAALSANTYDKVVNDRLEAFTPATCTTKPELNRQLDEVRATGVAFDREEHTVGICALGTCLQIGVDELFAISVPLPAGRFYGHEVRLGQALIRCVMEIQTAYPHICAVLLNKSTTSRRSAPKQG